MPTFRRLLSFLGPYRRAVIGSLVLASLAMAMTVTIPRLVGQAIDAVQRGERPDVLLPTAAIVGTGVLRLGLTVTRRIVAGGSRSGSSTTSARGSTARSRSCSRRR